MGRAFGFGSVVCLTDLLSAIPWRDSLEPARGRYAHSTPAHHLTACLCVFLYSDWGKCDQSIIKDNGERPGLVSWDVGWSSKRAAAMPFQASGCHAQAAGTGVATWPALGLPCCCCPPGR